MKLEFLDPDKSFPEVFDIFVFFSLAVYGAHEGDQHVGQDQDHTIGLWSSCSGEWYDGKLEATSNGDTTNVFF